MLVKRMATLLPALALFAFCLPAAAQTDLTCADINFTPDMRAKYLDIDDACLDVVEVNGERFAKMTVELVRTRNNRATFRFLEADGGRGPTQTIELDSSWRANINGRSFRLRELDRGQQLNIYLPADRWEVHVPPDDTELFVVFIGVVMIDDTGGGETTTVAALPATASSIPMLGLLGSMALCAAFLLRIFRRR